MSNLILRIPSWRSLKAWGNSRLIKSSYIWFVLTPIAARALASMPGQLSFNLLGATFTVDAELPFRWAVFYFMAFSYVIAQATYAWACPPEVKMYKDFRSFRSMHSGMRAFGLEVARSTKRARGGDRNLLDLLRSWAMSARHTGSPGLKNAADVYLKYLKGDLSSESYSYEEFLGECSKDEGVLNDLFEVIVLSKSKEKTIFRFVSSFFFLMGTILFVVLCVESLMTVVELIRR